MAIRVYAHGHTRIRVWAFAYFAHVLVRLFLSGTVVVVHRKNKPIRKHLLCIFFEKFYWGPTYRMNSFCHRHRQSDFISKWLSFLLHVQRSTPFNIVNWKKKSQGTPNRSDSVNLIRRVQSKQIILPGHNHCCFKAKSNLLSENITQVEDIAGNVWLLMEIHGKVNCVWFVNLYWNICLIDQIFLFFGKFLKTSPV